MSYVAWGENPEGGFWVAVWDDDEGPVSEETFAADRDEAERVALEIAAAEGLEAVEVDEMGPLATRGAD